VAGLNAGREVLERWGQRAAGGLNSPNHSDRIGSGSLCGAGGEHRSEDAGRRNQGGGERRQAGSASGQRPACIGSRIRAEQPNPTREELLFAEPTLFGPPSICR
jgi:hypothetical protein